MSLLVFLLAFLIMALVMAGMAIGAMAGRGPLKGSCGGLSAVGIEGRCEICGDDPARCENPDRNGAADDRADFYDAAQRSGSRGAR
jgi:hypothetical protein